MYERWKMKSNGRLLKNFPMRMERQIVGDTRLEKQNFVYITHNHNDMYDVEHSTSYGESRLVVLKTFKRFSNAKRYAEQWILNNYEI